MEGGDPALQQAMIDYLAPRPPGPLLAVLRCLLTAKPVGDLHPTPVLRLRGSNDLVADRTPDDIELGLTHFSFLEEPDAYASQVAAFIEGLPGRGR